MSLTPPKAATSAKKIAAYFIWASRESAHFHGVLTPRKLMKLMYIAQAWFLCDYEMPLFPEDFEAWLRGPVIPNIYGPLHSQFGADNPIPLDCEVPRPRLAKYIKDHLDSMVEVYMCDDQYVMEKDITRTPPFLNARKIVNFDKSMRTYVIPKSDIEKYYVDECNLVEDMLGRQEDET